MEKDKNIELFRFKIIEPFLKKKKKLKEIEKEKNISYATLKRWVNSYKKNGLIGLEKKVREDKNSYRTLEENSLNIIKEMCSNSSETNITNLYKQCKEKFLKDFSISYATFYRVVNNLDNFFNKSTVEYMKNIKKKNHCYLLLEIPLYILVSDNLLRKKVVPRLLLMLDTATLEPINFSIDYSFSSFYSLLSFIRECVLKVSLNSGKLTLPKEILVSSENINNKKILKEIYTTLNIKITEHYTENNEVEKFIEFIKNDIDSFYQEKKQQLTLLELSEFLSSYIYFQKKNYAFSINYKVIDKLKYIRQLDIFLQPTSRKIVDTKVRVKNLQYFSALFKELNGKNIAVKFSPINPYIIYCFLQNKYIGVAKLN